MRIKLTNRIALWGIRILDLLQSGILKNYRLFSFIVGRAPQNCGATACRIRAGKEFLHAYARVPAYKKFLEDQDWSCHSADIEEIFVSLPVMDKKNYILAYPTEDRCLDGRFFDQGVVIDESSGSTGIPYNWVRSVREREMVKDVIGVYLRYCFGDQKYIVLNLFSMGAWATGFNMAIASQSLGVVKSVGPDIDKILDTMRFFGNKYPYILNGYGRKDSMISIMGANIYPEDVESVVFSDPLLARFVHSFTMSLAEDAVGNPRPRFDFELSDLGQRSGIEAVLVRMLPLGLARLSRDYKKAREEYAESVEPIIRTFGLNEGPFKEDPGRIKKRYVR